MERRHRLRLLCWLIVVVLVVGIGGAWLRDSSLVAVKHVEIEGTAGQDSERLRSALTAAAQDMTTLHIRKDELEVVAEPYPTVASIDVDRKLPNTIKISIRTREPVAAIVAGGVRQAVAADGVILRGVRTGAVPVVRLGSLPAGERITSGKAYLAIKVLGAAPAPLRAKIRELRFTKEGIVVDLHKGPEIRFGDSSRPNAKWLAAARVLADKSSAGATYVNVAMPERPGAGGLENPSDQTDPRAGNEAETPDVPVTAVTTTPTPTTPVVTTEITNSQ